MCHPTTSDVLFRSGDRVLSGLCLRGGMRAGGDVFDLYGRVPGSRTRRESTRCSGALAQSACQTGNLTETLIFEPRTKFQQQNGPCRVGVRGATAAHSGKVCRESECAMTEGTDFPVRHSATARAGGSIRVRPCSAGAISRAQGKCPLLPSDSGFRVDDPDAPSSHGPKFNQSFRRISQKSAVGGEILTSGNHTETGRQVAGTSRIVLVTSAGNVGLAN